MDAGSIDGLTCAAARVFLRVHDGVFLAMIILWFALALLCALAVLLAPVARLRTMPARRRVMAMAIVATCFCGGVVGIYAMVGAPQVVSLMQDREQRMAVAKAAIADASKQVAADPRNLKAWAELGDGLMETQQFPAAANAYKRAVVLSGGHPQLILAYVRAQVMQAGGTVTEDAKRGLDAVLLQSKDNPEALYFTAIYDLQNGREQAAMQRMKALYRSLPEGDSLKERIDRQIGKK